MSVSVRVEKDGWVRCGVCGHKLFKLTDKRYRNPAKPEFIEVKCHSCKVLNRW